MGVVELALGPGCKTQVSQKQNSSWITVVFVPVSGRDRPSPVTDVKEEGVSPLPSHMSLLHTVMLTMPLQWLLRQVSLDLHRSQLAKVALF